MTHRTEQCCKECSGWEPALHECSCQCHYSPNDTSVVEEWEEELMFVMEDYLTHTEMRHLATDVSEHLKENREHWQKLKTFIRSLLTTTNAQHKAEVEKAVREEKEKNIQAVYDILGDIGIDANKEEIRKSLTNKES